VRVLVDRAVCDLHGQCVFTAPALFRFDETGALEYTGTEIPPELEPTARSAASVCPTGAIQLLDE
jgi:ferredoxin